MPKTLFILRYQTRALARAIRAHTFELFILGPIILGGALWVLHRLAGHAQGPIARAIDTHGPWGIGAALAVPLVLLQVPAVFRDLRGPSATVAALDAAPIPSGTRFAVALAAAVARNLPVMAVLLILSTPLVPSAGGTWVHRGLLLTLVAFPLGLAQLLLARALGPRTPRPVPSQRRRPWLDQPWLAPLLGRSRAEQALVRRDLRLVLRRFSPAVPLVWTASLILVAVALLVLLDGGLPVAWRQRLAVLATALATLLPVMLLPFLLKFQLPRFWMEKSSGADDDTVWRSKMRAASLLTIPGFLVGALLLLALLPLPMVERWMAVGQLALATWMATSLIAVALFEIASQPILGLVFGSMIALAMACLVIFYPKAWWLWLAFHAYLLGQVAGRAGRRVHLTDIER